MKLINKPVVLLIFSLILLLSIGSVCAVDTGDISVLDVDDSGIGDISSVGEVPVVDDNVNNVGANPGSFSDLQTIVSRAPKGSTINLTTDYKYNNNAHDSKSGITIDKDLTIDGNGHTIDGSNLARLFWLGGTRTTITLKNCILINGYSSSNAGAITTYPGASSVGKLLTLDNCTFINNSANGPGTIKYQGGNVYIINSTFVNNKVLNYDYASNVKGGVVYCDENVTIINSTFIDNSAYKGGVISSKGVNISDSQFINNSATYGGAIGSNLASVSNSTFINNTAICGGGAIFAINATIDNCVFNNNSAGVGNDLLVLSNLELLNTNIDSDNLVFYNASKINKYDWKDSFCSEWFIPNSPTESYLTDKFEVFNGITGQNVTDYLKILIYYYYDSVPHNNMINLIQQFTDSDFTVSTNKIIIDVIGKYDNGTRISDNPIKILDNGTIIKICFGFGISPTQQNIVLYNISEVLPNLTVEKISINPVVYIGEQTSFIVKVTNNGNCDLVDVFVFGSDYKDLIYDKFSGNNWTKEGDKFLYNSILTVGESANFTITFNTTKSGTFTNVVIAGSNLTNNKTANNTTIVFTPNLIINKSTLNPVVYVGNKTSFLLTVINVGDCNLTGVYIIEDSFDDLIFDSWKPITRNWSYSFNNGLHKWTLYGSLSPNETASFIVVFNTVSPGNKTNVIFGGSNEIDNVSAMNVTEVINTTTPGPEPTPTPTPTPEPTPVPGPEPSPEPSFESGSEPVVNKMVSTGNPLALIIISLFTIFVGGLKRKI